MQFIRVRNVKKPVRNVAENAGIDFYVPEFDAFSVGEIAQLGCDCEIDTENKTITIMPHTDVLIPSGIKSKFPNNIALVAFNKSGVATKKKLIVGAEVIDSAYQGEWHLHLINTSDVPQTISFGQKIVQFIPIVISTDEVEVLDVPEDEFFTEKTERGAGGFGSTGV